MQLAPLQSQLETSMSKQIVSRRSSAALAVALAATAACTDHRAPTAADPANGDGGGALAALACTVDVRAGSMACDGASVPNASASRSSGRSADGGPRLDLTVGGQNTYIRLATVGPQTRDDATAIVSGPVTVTNLMSQPLGTADGSTVSGVRVFFHQLPTVTQGTGTVEVANPDGFGVFTGASQPYFLYNQILQPGETSAPKTWQFRVPATVTRFVFQVYVRAASPGEAGPVSMRWTVERQSPVPAAAEDLMGIWRSGSGDLFAVGAKGRILRKVAGGSDWTDMPSGTTATLRGVWGTSSTDVYVVGDTGIVLHYDGASWTRQVSGTTATLLGIWGKSASDIIVVGNSSTILHSAGDGAWSAEAPPTGVSATALTGVWGDPAGEFYFAVGAAGRIFRRDVFNSRATWRQMTGTQTTNTLNAIYGVSPTVFFAVGDRGTLLTCRPSTDLFTLGASCSTALIGGITNNLLGVWASSEGSVDVIGNGVVITRRSFGNFTVLAQATNTGTYYDVTGGGLGDVWVAGSFGRVLHNPGESNWSVDRARMDLVGVHGSGASDVYAVGRNFASVSALSGATVLRYDGASWSKDLDSWQDLRAVWAVAPGDVWAVGSGGTIMHRVPGAGWTTLAKPPQASPSTAPFLNAIWASGPNDIWIAGVDNGGVVYRGNASSGFTAVGRFPASIYNLRAIWGSGPNDVYAAGDNGTIFHYQNGTWTDLSLPSSGIPPFFTGVWGTGPNDVVLAAGAYQSLYRGNAQSGFAFTPALDANCCNAVWGSAADDYFVVGYNGLLLRTGVTGAWMREATGTAATLTDVWGSSSSNVFIVGEGELIVHGTR